MRILVATVSSLALCTALIASRSFDGLTSVARRTTCPRGGSAGGSIRNSSRVAAAYAMSFDTVGARLDAAMLLRGQSDWEGQAGDRVGSWPPSLPTQAGERSPSLSGATVDTFAVLFDRANDVAWIGGQRVPLDGANVVLLDHADGVGGAPIVVARLHVEPHLSSTDTTCDMADPRRGSVLAAMLTADSQVRAFAEP